MAQSSPALRSALHAQVFRNHLSACFAPMCQKQMDARQSSSGPGEQRRQAAFLSGEALCGVAEHVG